MPEIEFHERKDLSVVAGVHIGGQVVCMSPEEWLETARDIVAQVEAHLTQRALDAAGRCACGLGLLPDGTCPMHFQYTTPRQ